MTPAQFEEVWAAHFASFQAWARRAYPTAPVDDLVQEAFLSLLDQAEVPHPRAALKRTFLWRLRDWHRAQKRTRRHMVPLNSDDDPPPQVAAPSQTVRELRKDLSQAVAALPEPLQDAVTACYVDGWTASEAAARLGGLRANTLEVRLHRARRALAGRLKDWRT